MKVWQKPTQHPGIDRRKVLVQLRELLEAIDRRVPQPDRKSETRIASEAAVLRRQAQERMTQLDSCCDRAGATACTRSVALPP